MAKTFAHIVTVSFHNGEKERFSTLAQALASLKSLVWTHPALDMATIRLPSGDIYALGRFLIVDDRGEVSDAPESC